MIRFLRKLWNDRRGNALIIAAACMPIIIGAAGLGSDTVQWVLWKRQLQRAADSAAIAAVHQIAEDDGSRTNVTTAVDRDVSADNHVGIATAKTVGAPSSGAYAADPFAVQVTLAVQKRLGFSSFFLSSTPTISATATATVVPDGEYCVVSLENTSATGITAGGNASVDLGCGMITNSTSMNAAVAFGSSDVTATPVAAVGGIDASDNWGAGTVLQPFTLAQQDPFADVDPPAVPAHCNGNLSVSPNATQDLSADTGVQCYRSMNLKGHVTLGSATYYIDGGSVSIGSQANVSCNGCTIVLTNSDPASTQIGTFTMNGGPTLNLTAPATGDFAGIAVYQDRRASGGTNNVNGNSSSFLQGALYFPTEELDFSGDSGMNTNCLQIVSRRVTFIGNNHISNSCPANSGASAFTGQKVRLVA